MNILNKVRVYVWTWLLRDMPQVLKDVQVTFKEPSCVNLNSDSILVVHNDAILSEAFIKKITNELSKILLDSGYKNKILVMHGGMTLSSISKGDEK